MRPPGCCAPWSPTAAELAETAYPVLFGTTQASWAPIDLRFELPTGDADPPFALLRCHSRAPAPYRPHEPHPDYDCLYGYGEVELVGPPQLQDGAERTVAVEMLAPSAAVSLLAAKGRPWEAELYRLAANRRAAALGPSRSPEAAPTTGG